jgi:hypothetical protein
VTEGTGILPVPSVIVVTPAPFTRGNSGSRPTYPSGYRPVTRPSRCVGYHEGAQRADAPGSCRSGATRRQRCSRQPPASERTLRPPAVSIGRTLIPPRPVIIWRTAVGACARRERGGWQCATKTSVGRKHRDVVPLDLQPLLAQALKRRSQDRPKGADARSCGRCLPRSHDRSANDRPSSRGGRGAARALGPPWRLLAPTQRDGVDIWTGPSNDNSWSLRTRRGTLRHGDVDRDAGILTRTAIREMRTAAPRFRSGATGRSAEWLNPITHTRSAPSRPHSPGARRLTLMSSGT